MITAPATLTVKDSCPRCGGLLVLDELTGDEWPVKVIKCFMCSRMFFAPEKETTTGRRWFKGSFQNQRR